MTVRLDEIEAIVRKRICPVCDERGAADACGLDPGADCSLFRLFPLVAQAILATDSGEIGPYLQAIHENVCSVCIEQRLDGSCPAREQTRCALDSHLAEIVEAIEEATGRTFERPRTTNSTI
ncbi:MAG: hypothetical protein ABSG25_12330 [Bryobacteraceae bacterium]